ncbi:MAG: hypothetical protein WD875_00835 [Pirellulales bacterium]
MRSTPATIRAAGRRTLRPMVRRAMRGAIVLQRMMPTPETRRRAESICLGNDGAARPAWCTAG